LIARRLDDRRMSPPRQIYASSLSRRDRAWRRARRRPRGGALAAAYAALAAVAAGGAAVLERLAG